MYKLEYETENKNYSYEFENPETIFKTKQYKLNEKVELANVFDKIDYGMIILKPLPEKKDYQIIYSNKILWEYFNTKLHTKLPRCLLIEVISEITNKTKIKLNNNSQA